MSDIEFIDGLYIDPPHEKAPDFVKCKISINKNQFLEWLKKKIKEDNSVDYINIDVKVARSSGNWYASVDNWKPDKEKSSPATQNQKDDFDDDDDIPF